MRRYLPAMAVCVSALAAFTANAASSFPTKPIRLIVPASPGTGSDFFARTMSQGLSELYEHPVVIDNRPGAGGIVGATTVASATPDGYTIGLASSTSFLVAPMLQLKPAYRPLEDFRSVAQLAAIPSVLIVAPNVPAKTVKELIALAKSKPGGLNYASVGPGTAAHLSSEIFNRAAGITAEHVPFRTIAAVFSDMTEGRVHYLWFVSPAAMGLLRGGKLRAIAVDSPKRSPTLPDVPTIREEGYPAAEMETLFGIFAPVGTASATITKLNADIVKVLRKPETMKAFALQAAEPTTVDTAPDAYAKRLKVEYDRFRKLLPEIGLKPQ